MNEWSLKKTENYKNLAGRCFKIYEFISHKTIVNSKAAADDVASADVPMDDDFAAYDDAENDDDATKPIMAMKI